MDYSTLGKEPIAGEKPAGIDCRYEPEFETLQAEIDKLSSPTSDGKVDWAKVTQLAGDILSQKSKDLTVASYLAVGLVHQRQVAGLDEGIQVFRDMVENYWDALFPSKKRMRGRLGALAWWLEKTEEVLEKLNPDPLAADQFRRLQDNIEALDSSLAENMPDPPLLRPLQRHVERFPVQKEEAPKEEATAAPAPDPVATAAPQAVREEVPAPAPVSDRKPPSPASTDAPQSISTEQEALKSIDAAAQLIRKASHFLLQQDLKNPSAYRFRRMAAWARIDELPPNKEGITQIPPPAPQIIDPLKELHETANWPALIENTETKVSQFVFWFDLQFMVAEGLKNLGPDYQPALAAVCQETAYFLQRFPEMENLAFSNEMPFADMATRKWLAGIGFGSSASGSVAESQAIGGQLERINGVTQDALGMARKKKVAEALDLLFKELRKAVSLNEQTRWRLAMAQVLMASKKTTSALPHLEKVVCDIDAFKLEQWDPDLALEGLVLAWKGFSSEGGKTHQERTDELLNRIANLDPAQALRLGS